ncbi:MAG: hypothetical protein ACHQ49_08290 [Elusimicrobiota bacterium]
MMTQTRRFGLEWLGVFLFCAALSAYFQFRTPFLPEADCYYHIKFAWLLRHHGFFRHGFPWAYFSLWRDGFSDGSVVFHLLLIPFTFGDLIFGCKLAGVLFSAFALSSFFAVLALNRVRARFYWFGLLLAGGGYFWWRMLVPRPQVLSAALLLWSLHFLLNGRRRAFAALSFIYPLSYVAAFLPQAFAALRWAYLKAVARRSDGGLLAAGLAAYALALLVHPYFPKNLTFLYVQNFYAMFMGLTQRVDLHMGNELLPLDTRQFVGGNLPLLANLLGLGFVAMHRRRALSERTLLTFPIMIAVVLLSCVSKRFLEYSVPVATLFAAFLFTDVLDGYAEDDFARDFGTPGKAFALCWLAALGAAFGVEASMVRRDFSRTPPPRFEELARAVAAKAPAGEVVYACDWDEPPELLFFNEKNLYPVMLDPTFMYYWDPGLWKRWSDVSNARLTPDETLKTLTDTFHARFGVCGAKFSALRALLGADPRFAILAENERGFAFEIR